MLPIVGEQYAVTVEQLGLLMGRSFRAGRWLRDRWQRAGWIESRPLLAAGPSFVWLSSLGVQVAASPYRRWQPNPTLITHIEAVTQTRLLLERQLRLGLWESERAVAKAIWSSSQERPHIPDAVLDTPRGRVAIEVELSLKSRARIEQVVRDLAGRYPQVWYFAAPPALGALQTIAAQMPYRGIAIHRYPPCRDELAL